MFSCNYNFRVNSNQKQIINYYQGLESRLGYTFLTWNAKHFGFYPTNQNDISEKKAQELLQDYLWKKLSIKKKNHLILDAGSGRGIVSLYLAKKYGAHVIGIDLVPFEVELAKRLAEKLKLEDKVKYIQGDYSEIPLESNSCEAIYTMETLVHASNLSKTLKEFKRVLKPKGKFVLFEYSVSSKREFTQREWKIFNLISKGSAMHSLPVMRHNQIKHFLKKAGFSKIKDEEITSQVLPSMKRFYKYARLPYIFISLLKLHKYFINTTWAVEFYKIFSKRLLRYRVFEAEKA